MNLNGQMIVLARELRGMTQDELARKALVSQATIARIESEMAVEVSEERTQLIANALDVPVPFLSMKEDLIGVGSSAYYYRKKNSLSASDMKRIHGIVNLLRIHIKKMLSSVEIVPKRKLPLLLVDEFGSPTRVAQALRQAWNVPDGPIRNLTNLVESAGVIVVNCNFGTNYMDATSIRLAEIPPIVFMNKDVPGDRWRFTLAHELGHLLMHDVPCEAMEDEADEFAAELLMPTIEMKAFFSRHSKLRLQDLANQKPFWKVSIAALIERAWNLGAINESARRYLWASLKKTGYPQEPHPVPKESPINHTNMLDYFFNQLSFTEDDMATLFSIKRQDLEFLHGFASKRISPRHLSAVR